MGDTTNYESAIKPSEGLSHASVGWAPAGSECDACLHALCHLDAMQTASNRIAINQRSGNAAPIGVLIK